jgi:hypothetical protein
MTQVGFFTSEEIPPWLPPQAKEARSHVFWAQIISFVEIPVAILLSILMFYYYFKYSSRPYIVTNPSAAGFATDFLAFAIYFILIVFVCALELAFTKAHISNAIDSGKYLLAQERSLLWGVLSIVFGLIPGILLIAASTRLGELGKQSTPQPFQAATSTAQEKAGETHQTQKPAASQQQTQVPHITQEETKQSPYVIPAAQKPHTDMVKCKKCGASYPAFMHACPSCNEPKS